jgi:hypothetical protein
MPDGLLRLPICVGYISYFPIIPYADDTLLIMEVCPQQLFALKTILNTLDSIDLKVNYSKSSMVPINNVSHERLQHLASTFQCQARAFPFTYLGLPLCSNNPTIQDCMPLVHRVERRLVSTSQ